MPDMSQPTITVIIHGQAHQLNAEDPESLAQLPARDRAALLRLLLSFKSNATQSAARSTARPAAVAKPAPPPMPSAQTPPQAATPVPPLKSPPTPRATNPAAPQREAARKDSAPISGAEDVEALMSRLILEQGQSRPSVDKTAVYKWFAVFIVAVIIIGWVF